MWANFFIGFMAGLAAAPHCLGMCGGFPLHLAQPSGRGPILLRQVLFILGKSFTYIFLGTLAAAVGTVLFRDTALQSSAPILRMALGVLIAMLGLVMLGVRFPQIKLAQIPTETGFFPNLVRGFLASPSPLGAFALGIGVGFLPCPLPMGMLAIAAGTRDLTLSIALMAGVGVGTAPGLLAVGILGAGINRGLARIGTRAAGAIMLLLGLLIIARTSGIVPNDSAINHIVPTCCQGK